VGERVIWSVDLHVKPDEENYDYDDEAQER
jgi:hypothetical protein